MRERLRARTVVTEAGTPVRRDAIVELGGDRVACVRDATVDDGGPVCDLLLPGLIDAHSHARGLALAHHGIGEGPLERFLLELRALTSLSPEDEALVAAHAALATGITSIQVIHHSFGDAERYAAQARGIADACAVAGVRAFIALAVTDQDEYAAAARVPCGVREGIPVPGRGLDPEAFSAIAARLLGERGLVSTDAVGPVAPQWCSDRALHAIRAVPGARRVHAHLLESVRQRLAPDGDPVRRLAEAGLLSGVSSFAHGVWLDDDQIGRIADAGATIVHCPGSNARLGVGTCPVRRLLGAGIPVALGLDSHGASDEADVFAEMRLALELAANAGAPLSATEVLAMATVGGARALCRADLGTLRPGAAADLVAIDLPGVTNDPDPIGHLIQHARPSDVVATWVAGRRRQPSAAAANARARLLTAVADDTEERSARLAEARAAWEAVDAVWRELEAHVSSSHL